MFIKKFKKVQALLTLYLPSNQEKFNTISVSIYA